MKIQGTGELAGRVHAETVAARGPCSKTLFGDILSQAMGPASGAALSAGMPASPGPPPLERQVEGFLDLLEDYRCQLADPRVSLKGLDATVRKMEAGRDALSPQLEMLGDGDGLRAVLDNVLVVAELEIIRYRRGDYLPV